MYEYEYSKLRGKIREVCGTQYNFSKEIGLSTTSISNKLNNIVDWNQDEMEKVIDVLHISNEEIYQYFFTKKVEKNSNN